MKSLNLSAFIGTGFDMYFRGSHRESEWVIGRLGKTPDCYEGFKIIIPNQNEAGENVDTYYPNCKPRTNCPQVLDDWSFVERLEGAVWKYGRHLRVMRSNELLNITVAYSNEYHFASFIGVEKGSGLEDWANPNSVPVIDMENSNVK